MARAARKRGKKKWVLLIAGGLGAQAIKNQKLFSVERGSMQKNARLPNDLRLLEA